MSNCFEWYDLRTTDVAAACSFYAELLDCQVEPVTGAATLFRDGAQLASISTLPESARERGAPAHWLGLLTVPDVAQVLASLLAAGARLLSPPTAEGPPTFAVVRDPFGALFGLRAPGKSTSRGLVRSHDHLSADTGAAWALYAQFFGWHLLERSELGAPSVRHQRFCWFAEGPGVGALVDTAHLPRGVHSQWLYYFGVPDIERASERVRARGGLVVGEPLSLPFGARITQCEDPQGAAFGLWEG